MTGPMFLLVAQVVVVAPLGVALIGGLLAIRALFGDRLRARPERWAAIAIAFVMAVAVAVLFELFIAGFAGMDTGVTTSTYLLVLPYALVAFAASLLAGLIGYVALSWFWRSRGAAIGGLIGVGVIVGMMQGASAASQMLTNAAYDASAAEAAATIADRSAGITMKTEVLDAALDASGLGVADLHLRVTLTSDRDIPFDVSSKLIWPRFAFTNVGQGMIELEAAPSDPTGLAAGAPVVWDLTFIVPPEGPYSGTYQVPGPGTWTLRVLFDDAGGGNYELTQDVVVAPTP
jgi:hypothetical protein